MSERMGHFQVGEDEAEAEAHASQPKAPVAVQLQRRRSMPVTRGNLAMAADPAGDVQEF
jgi:hypothetical protein